MRDAVIVDVVRTPLGRGKVGGQLNTWHPVDLAAYTLKALVERTGVDPALIEDVIMGCVSQTGEQGTNIARNARFREKEGAITRDEALAHLDGLRRSTPARGRH